MKHSIKSLKFIYFLAKYNSDNYPKVNVHNETYVGLDNKLIPLKILTKSKQTDTASVIMFPGASPDAEEHTGMLFLASIICKLGYNVLIPRIPPLKELELNSNSFDWVAHAYSEIIQRPDILKDKVIAMGLSFGGGVLLKNILIVCHCGGQSKSKSKY